MTFSTVRSEDLKIVGVVRKRLVFEPAKVIELSKVLPTSAEAEILDLHFRIKKIYARVNMDVCFSLNYLCVWWSNRIPTASMNPAHE